ncbi:MAG: hypothetical protein V4568_19405 [Pseudomonadota bacterium]
MKTAFADFQELSVTKFLPSFACVITLCIFIYWAIAANIDLSMGRFALYMDERITFDGVKKILHPDGLRSFFWAITNGGDQRYGRSLWNSIAAFSFLPERLWGDSGQIIAGRMLQVFMLAATCFIFLFGFLRNWYLRLVLMVAILAMPYSDYYMTMPKPEPLQLFFLAIFCYYFFRNKLELGWYWIFAGLAFGTKISTLPALVVFAAASFIAHLKYGSTVPLGKSIKIALSRFFYGLAIAVPILLTPVLLTVGGYHLFLRIKEKFRLNLISQGVLVSLGVIVISLASRKPVKSWVNNTFLSTKHGADQASVNALSWINYFFEKWLIAPEAVGIVFIIGVLIYISAIASMELSKPGINFHKKIAALTITLSGITLNLAIFFGAQRLWGFYLYPGTVLMVAGMVILVDLYISDYSETSPQGFKRLQQVAGYSVATILFCIASFFWAPWTISNLQDLSNRTKSSEYTQQYATYKEIVKFLNDHNSISNKKLKVMYTPSLFPPDNSNNYEIVEFWGPYVEWDKSPDVIVFGPINTPRGTPTSPESPSYKSFLAEREGYSKHVTDKGANCQANPCFERELLLPNGGEILALKKG